MIDRSLEKVLLKDFGKRKILVILGPRQTGKTTLLEKLSKSFSKCLWLNCDNADDASLLKDKSSTELKELLSGNDAVFIDEAQRVRNVGLALKKIGDLKLPDTQVFVTGSSSLDLSNGINEPATGRLWNYRLYPFSLRELSESTSRREEQRLLERRMIYGLYPEVVSSPSDAKRILMTLTDSYLYKDLLSYNGIRKHDIIQNLVQALALQLGSEVSYNELSNLLGIDKQTVESYIDLLEKCFVVFRLPSFSSNQRNEIKKGKKIYFYDNGIRNAVISNFAPLSMRNDTGALWENLMISERVKRNSYAGEYAKLFFWRTHSQAEIDLIEINDGKTDTYEFKWNPRRNPVMPTAFKTSYPDSTFKVITPDNYWDFV